MCFRWLLLLPLLATPASASEPGGHPLELGISLSHVDFDDEIRFANDVAYSLGARLGFTSWLSLGVDLSAMTMRDERRDAWSDAVLFAIDIEAEPSLDLPVVPFGSLGVSFMGFQETELTDAISEGLDLGLGVRWAVSPRWNVRGGMVSRIQTFRLIPIAPDGTLLPVSEETGFLWSRVWELGVSHVF